MIRRLPRSTRTDTLFPYTTLFRSLVQVPHCAPARPATGAWRRSARAVRPSASGPKQRRPRQAQQGLSGKAPPSWGAILRGDKDDLQGCSCTPQLLGQHDPRHHMRPGRPTEGNQQIRPLPLRFIETVSRPDQEAALTDPLVAPCLQLAGEFHGRKLLALLIRSEARRVGTECVSTCRSRWSPYN